jgi:hypothetical protein
LSRLPAYSFGALCLLTGLGFLLFPTYPNYDSYYSLLWGREVLDLDTPFFEGFRVPTEHPLAIVAGALLSLVGEVADRIWIALTLATLLVLVWGVYRLAARAFTPVVGLIAAALLVTRFDFAFLAARGYIDIPFMALVVWAAVLEFERPRRGTPVFLLLGLAGMLRPEAWFMAAIYWAWYVWKTGWADRAKATALAALGPAVWFGVDFAVTGDPLFSLNYTSASADDLGRSRTLSELPGAVPYFLSNLVKLPVLLAAVAGIVLAFVVTPRRALGPFTLFATGLVTFFAIGVAGASVIERYLVVAALGLLIFAAVSFGGWTMLAPGRLRTGWMAAAVLVAIGGFVYTALNVNLRRFENELTFRGDAHVALVDVLRDPAVTAGLRCGPLTFPNHKLVPDGRWILDLPADRVFARADTGKGTRKRPDAGKGAAATTGVAIYAVSRIAIFKHAFTDKADAASIQVPPPGWERKVTSDFYAAYVRC